jgi:hypothetical protein
MSKWRHIDPWSDDDPAIARMRAALALQPTPEPSERPEARGDAPDAAAPRERIAALVQRIETGDVSAVATLRELLEPS